MKRSDLIKEEIAAAKENAKKVLANGKATIDEVNAATINIDTLEAKLKLALKEEEEILASFKGTILDNKDSNTDPNAYEEAFIHSLKGKATIEHQMTIQAALSSTTEADGGLLIPKDQETRIIELERELCSLKDIVNVEVVTTLSGTRIVEKDAEYTAFAEITEGTKLTDIANGQFEKIAYNCKTYGGLLPIPNNLLNDTKENILGYINKWFAKKKVATENKLILEKLNTISKTEITSIDDIKTAINVTLDPKISANSIIVTNQTGFNLLDQMKDNQGNYLLENNPTNPTQKMIKGRPVLVFPDKVIPNNTGKAPVLIGNFKNGITLFDRKLLTVDSTSIGAGAFENNTTIMRGLMRLDVQKVDSKAIVSLELKTAKA